MQTRQDGDHQGEYTPCDMGASHLCKALEAPFASSPSAQKRHSAAVQSRAEASTENTVEPGADCMPLTLTELFVAA